MRYAVATVAFLLAILPCHAATLIRVRLWSQHPPQKIEIRSLSNAQIQMCANCQGKPFVTSIVSVNEDGFQVDGRSVMSIKITGSYEIVGDSVPIRLTSSTEIAAKNGYLRIVSQLPLEEYVAAVVNGEAGGIRSDEALKAMAVAVRTYALHFRSRHAFEGFDLCDSTHCQDLRLTSMNQRARNAASATEGEIVWYQGATAATFYHQDCGGMLEAGGFQPGGPRAAYLEAKSDPYCVRRGGSAWHIEIRKSEIVAALRNGGVRTPATIHELIIASRTNTGRAALVRLVGESTTQVPAEAFRYAIGRNLGWNLIRSDMYEISDRGDSIAFSGHGYGHGIGLCQAGAVVMAQEGHSYLDILNNYYPHTTVALTAAGLRWTSVSSSRLELLTTRADADSAILPEAAKALSDAEQKIGWSLDTPLQLRVFPTLDAYRDSTGEPGWVAASTRGRVVRLQPFETLQQKGVLSSTLRHEFLHALIDSHSKSNLPVWFREGLVLWLEGGTRSKTVGLTDASLEQSLTSPASEKQLRNSYLLAAARVNVLVMRYGKNTVLNWLQAGIPKLLPN